MGANIVSHEQRHSQRNRHPPIQVKGPHNLSLALFPASDPSSVVPGLPQANYHQFLY